MRRVKITEASEFAEDFAELTATYKDMPPSFTDGKMVSTELPAAPAQGDVWYDTVNSRMHAYIDGKWAILS